MRNRFKFGVGLLLLLLVCILGVRTAVIDRGVQAMPQQEYNYLVGDIRRFTDSLSGNGATITAIADDLSYHSYHSWHNPMNKPTQGLYMLVLEFSCAYNEPIDLDPYWNYLRDPNWVCVR